MPWFLMQEKTFILLVLRIYIRAVLKQKVDHFDVVPQHSSVQGGVTVPEVAVRLRLKWQKEHKAVFLHMSAP
jgi:hypothetical protein